jgi:DHA1 family bicyclomycin/chloramphenicol resistance-like MFS transporter
MSLLQSPPSRLARAPSLALLVWITISGTFPIHVFVPALPAVASDFATSASALQFTITLYMVGLSIGQLVYGPLSDRFGRRPILICGLALYTAGTIAAAVAGSLASLIAARMTQALGGCVGLVLGRTIARDSVGHEHVVGRLALLSSVMSFAPALAPLVGSLLTAHFGWRSIFVVLGIANVLVLMLVILTLPETHDRTVVLPTRVYAQSYFRLLRSPLFLGYAIGGACATTSFYAFVTASPFVLMEERGMSPQHFGLLYLLIVAAVAIGGAIANVTARRVSNATMLRFANSLIVVGAATLCIGYLLHALPIALIVGAMITFVIGAGIASPIAMAGAINADPVFAGAASGLYGFLQMINGILCTAAVALGHSNSTGAMIAVLAAASLVVTAAFALATRMSRSR